jgi:hypothetical protein
MKFNDFQPNETVEKQTRTALVNLFLNNLSINFYIVCIFH